MRLPFTTKKDWAYRWQVTMGWSERLHRIVAGKREDRFWVGARDARTACGLTGDFQMPGIFSRMGRPRCTHCCRVLGIKPGNGAPYNEGINS